MQMSSSPSDSTVLPSTAVTTAAAADPNSAANSNKTSAPTISSAAAAAAAAATDAAATAVPNPKASQQVVDSASSPTTTSAVAKQAMRLPTGELIDAKNTAGNDAKPLSRQGAVGNRAVPAVVPGVSAVTAATVSTLSTATTDHDPQGAILQTPLPVSTRRPAGVENLVEAHSVYIVPQNEQNTEAAVVVQETHGVVVTDRLAITEPFWRRTSIWLRVCGLAVLLSIVAIGGFCSSGNCSVRRNSSTLRARATALTNFINSIKLSPRPLAVPATGISNVSSTLKLNSTLPVEDTALAWLVYEDELQLWRDTAANQFQLQQRYALLTLLVQYPNFVESNAATRSGSECDWLYVSCTDDSTAQPTRALVTGIETALMAITAPGSTLSPDLGLLLSLQKFVVSENAMVGSLPSMLGSMWSNLEWFDVNKNRLTGSLPLSLQNVWVKLKYLDVRFNALTGSIPSLGNGSNAIQIATFNNNSFVGSMPSVFCNLSGTLIDLTADCAEVDCPCCIYCCSDVTGDCFSRFK